MTNSQLNNQVRRELKKAGIKANVSVQDTDLDTTIRIKNVLPEECGRAEMVAWKFRDVEDFTYSGNRTFVYVYNDNSNTSNRITNKLIPVHVSNH